MDAVLFVDVLEHVPDPAHLLREAARVLRPKGHLLACVPVEGEPIGMYSLYKALLGPDTYVETKEHVSAFTHSGLQGSHRRALRSRGGQVRLPRRSGTSWDATFFAAARMSWLHRNFWWRDNVYYNDEKTAAGGVGLMNKLLVAGNAVAWAESSLLARVPRTAAAMLVDAVVRA